MKLQTLTSLLLATATLSWAVPSEINYQGRLTDANGDAVTGDVAMSLKMFDAATEGNEIYSEDIGTVTLDSNGIYSFEFGASGQSVVDGTETIAGALSAADAHWLELSVDGTAQSPRERVLSVPFAQVAVNLATGSVSRSIENLDNLVESSIVSAEQAKAGFSNNFTQVTYSDFLSDANGIYNTIISNDLYFQDGLFLAQSGLDFFSLKNGIGYEVMTYYPSEPLKFVRFYTQSTSSSRFSPNASIAIDITYSDASTETLTDSKSWGYYTSGESEERYIYPSKPRLSVVELKITYNYNNIISEVEVVYNSSRTLEYQLPVDFIEQGYEYKAIPSYNKKESGALESVYLRGSFENMSILGEWTLATAAQAGARSLIHHVVPDLVSDYNSYTSPNGLIVLKRKQ